jgi:ATP-dependent exoDNAse (exonuclease V) beta subunit
VAAAAFLGPGLGRQRCARRILALKRSSPELNYGDIALLFRAMTQVQIYESVFRRANIPYQTVLGRGFYEREEITDLIQLLRFLDNKTDEIALASVLRSPLCGISDNALLASAYDLLPKVRDDPTVKERSAVLGMTMMLTTPEVLRARVEAEVPRWKQLIPTIGLKVD